MGREIYKNCEIERIYPPIPGTYFAWSHRDYDGAPDGNDTRCGFGRSIDACKRQIDDCEAINEPPQEKEA